MLASPFTGPYGSSPYSGPFGGRNFISIPELRTYVPFLTPIKYARQYADPDLSLQFLPDISRRSGPHGSELNTDPNYSSALSWVPSYSNNTAGGSILNGNGTVTLHTSSSASNSGGVTLTVSSTANQYYFVAVPVTSFGDLGIRISSNTQGSQSTLQRVIKNGSAATIYRMFRATGSTFTVKIESDSTAATPAIIGSVSIKAWDGIHAIQHDPTLRWSLFSDFIYCNDLGSYDANYTSSDGIDSATGSVYADVLLREYYTSEEDPRNGKTILAFENSANTANDNVYMIANNGNPIDGSIWHTVLFRAVKGGVGGTNNESMLDAWYRRRVSLVETHFAGDDGPGWVEFFINGQYIATTPTVNEDWFHSWDLNRITIGRGAPSTITHPFYGGMRCVAIANADYTHDPAKVSMLRNYIKSLREVETETITLSAGTPANNGVALNWTLGSGLPGVVEVYVDDVKIGVTNSGSGWILDLYPYAGTTITVKVCSPVTGLNTYQDDGVTKSAVVSNEIEIEVPASTYHAKTIAYIDAIQSAGRATSYEEKQIQEELFRDGVDNNWNVNGWNGLSLMWGNAAANVIKLNRTGAGSTSAVMDGFPNPTQNARSVRTASNSFIRTNFIPSTDSWTTNKYTLGICLAQGGSGNGSFGDFGANQGAKQAILAINNSSFGGTVWASSVSGDDPVGISTTYLPALYLVNRYATNAVDLLRYAVSGSKTVLDTAAPTNGDVATITIDFWLGATNNAGSPILGTDKYYEFAFADPPSVSQAVCDLMGAAIVRYVRKMRNANPPILGA